MNENTKVAFCAGTLNEYLPSKSVIVPKVALPFTVTFTPITVSPVASFNNTRDNSARLGLNINRRDQEEEYHPNPCIRKRILKSSAS